MKRDDSPGARATFRALALLGCVALSWAAATSARAAEPPAVPPPQVRAWQTGLLRPDRLHHAGFALTSGLSLGLLAREPAAAAAGGVTLGVLKEIWDLRRGRGFDGLDLAAGALGAAAATVVTAALRR
jgi:ABC-type nitrate/sulfonate/bicarbonate transport system permease component